jgi:hypothetical protein
VRNSGVGKAIVPQWLNDENNNKWNVQTIKLYFMQLSQLPVKLSSLSANISQVFTITCQFICLKFKYSLRYLKEPSECKSCTKKTVTSRHYWSWRLKISVMLMANENQGPREANSLLKLDECVRNCIYVAHNFLIHSVRSVVLFAWIRRNINLQDIFCVSET